MKTKHMKKLFFIALISFVSVYSNAQVDYSNISGKAIFPIVNQYEGNTSTEFVAADAIDGNMYAPRIPHYYRAQKMYLFGSSTPILIQTEDFSEEGYQNWFVSFNYISKTKGNGVTWNSGGSTQQFVFHPGGHSNEKDLLYAFLWQWVNFDDKSGDLYLVDVKNKQIVVKLASNIKGFERASINVFAQTNCDEKEMLVITDEKSFIVYDEIPSKVSSVNTISVKDKTQEMFDLNGRKIETPQKGIIIVKEENGNSKKYINR